jgi:hypothetical protein
MPDEVDTYIRRIVRTGITANVTVLIPAGYSIVDVIVRGTNGNAVTGGLRIGTSDGGSQVIDALAVAGNSLQSAVDGAALLKRVFSHSAVQTLYIQAVSAWNSANLSVTFILNRFIL